MTTNRCSTGRGCYYLDKTQGCTLPVYILFAVQAQPQGILINDISGPSICKLIQNCCFVFPTLMLELLAKLSWRVWEGFSVMIMIPCVGTFAGGSSTPAKEQIKWATSCGLGRIAGEPRTAPFKAWKMPLLAPSPSCQKEPPLLVRLSLDLLCVLPLC